MELGSIFSVSLSGINKLIYTFDSVYQFCLDFTSPKEVINMEVIKEYSFTIVLLYIIIGVIIFLLSVLWHVIFSGIAYFSLLVFGLTWQLKLIQFTPYYTL